MIDIHSGRDPLELPLYTVTEAASYLSVPPSTLRAWVRGQQYTVRGQPRRFKPLIKPDFKTGLLTFNNFVEAYVLASLTRKFSLPLARVRTALRWLDHSRPLLKALFQTDGIGLFVEKSGQLVDASAGGQVAMRQVLEGALERVDRDGAGHPARVYPWLKDPTESKLVTLDPRRAFGRPTIAGRSVTAEVIADRFRGGDSIEFLSKDYRLSSLEVQVAVRWGIHGAAAA